MRLVAAFKTALIAYVTFAGLFLLCLNVQHSLPTTMSEHGQQESTGCNPGATCDSLVRHHVDVITATSTILILLGFGTLISFLFTIFVCDREGFLYMKLWRNRGGGIHLFDFIQRLFARGILNQKTYNFVVA